MTILPTENNKEGLKELSSKERIDLMQGDSVRRWGQLIIAFVLIGMAIVYLTLYTFFEADEKFKLALALDMRVLLIMGVGAALAIFGLGRTVGRR